MPAAVPLTSGSPPSSAYGDEVDTAALATPFIDALSSFVELAEGSMLRNSLAHAPLVASSPPAVGCSVDVESSDMPGMLDRSVRRASGSWLTAVWAPSLLFARCCSLLSRRSIWASRDMEGSS